MAWGLNRDGQLGNGTRDTGWTPAEHIHRSAADFGLECRQPLVKLRDQRAIERARLASGWVFGIDHQPPVDDDSSIVSGDGNRPKIARVRNRSIDIAVLAYVPMQPHRRSFVLPRAIRRGIVVPGKVVSDDRWIEADDAG